MAAWLNVEAKGSYKANGKSVIQAVKYLAVCLV